MKDRQGYWIFWFALMAIGIVIFYLFFENSSSTPFRDLFLGDFFATILGVVIGVPVAIYLTRQQQKAEEKIATEERKSQLNQRKIQYLRMLQLSLMSNLSFLENIQRRLIPGAAIYSNLDIEQLEATASIKYEIIDDLKLNGFIDLVRFNLRYIRRLLDLSLDFCYGQQRFNLASEEFLIEHKRIVDRVLEELPKVEKNILDTLDLIRENLESAGVQIDDQGRKPMSESTNWYKQSLYAQAWENYRNEDENYRTILTQYLVFTAAFIYAVTQSIGDDARRIIGGLGAFVSLIAIFYIGRISMYSRRWLILKDFSIGDLANDELIKIKEIPMSRMDRIISSIPGHRLILSFPLAGLALFLLILFEVISFT